MTVFAKTELPSLPFEYQRGFGWRFRCKFSYPLVQIPEYACGTDESDVLNNAFQLIFAFDEIVALGYREDVNISQIRTFTEMDSHEERVFRAVQEVSLQFWTSSIRCSVNLVDAFS